MLVDCIDVSDWHLHVLGVVLEVDWLDQIEVVLYEVLTKADDLAANSLVRLPLSLAVSCVEVNLNELAVD